MKSDKQTFTEQTPRASDRAAKAASENASAKNVVAPPMLSPTLASDVHETLSDTIHCSTEEGLEYTTPCLA
jgi:hypothetical protein